MGEDINNIFFSLPETANLQLADPSLVSYYADLGSRRVWLNTEIDKDSIGNLCQNIIRWNQEDALLEPNVRQPITILFDSPGGDLIYYNTARDIFQLSLTPIIGINMSYTASAAALIFLFCHKRYALPNSAFLYHYGNIRLDGDAKNSIEIVKAYEKEVDEFVDVICAHSSYEKEHVKEKMQLDWEIKASEALDKNLIDGYVEDMSMFWGE